MDNKLPYKVFSLVIIFVSIITFFIMNYNSVPVSFIFFTVKLPLTLLFFICFFIGIGVASFYWYQKYKSLEKKWERTEKLLFTKEKLEDDSKNSN
ncbi:LapA family protein [Gemella cuniculi]|uniref:LapA family protein n=1 Tax=Gemella cuniculi TaxID=150240 RepID=UPI00040BC160|nr:LapA family protein [Gemella cuniculi]